MTDEVKPPSALGLSVPLTEAVIVAEVRRLRRLIIDAEPHVPDNKETRTMDLPARLKAEVHRG